MADLSTQRLTRRGLLKSTAAISGALALEAPCPPSAFAQPVAPPSGGKST